MDYQQQVALLQAIVDQLIHNGERVRIFYGDTQTGRDGHWSHGTVGYPMYSTGADGVPRAVLMPHKTSWFGTSISYRNIVKITKVDGGQVLYEHPNYHSGVFTIREPLLRIKDLGYAVYCDDVNIISFVTKCEAVRFIDFMLGQRNTR